MDFASEHWIKGGNTIIKALYNFRLPDGSFYTGEGTYDDFSTRQALIAMTDLVDAGYGTSIVPAAISVRVEGNDKNLASKRVVHTNGSALDALEQIVQGEYAVDSHGDVTSILDEEGRSVSEEVYTGWRYYVTRNGHPDPNTFRSKPGQYNVRQGDDVTFYVGAYYENPLTQSVFEATYIPVVNITPARPVVGETLKISVSGMVYSSDTGGFLSATIDPINVNNEEILNGLAEIALSKAGTFTYQIHKQHDDGYPLLVRSNHIVIVNQPQGSGDIGGGTISVTVLVRGKNGVVIGSFIVKLTKDDSKGLNPIYALQQTGLEVELKHNDRYVYSIDGITEDSGSTAGWKYKVNGVAPATLAAKDYRLEDGDEVEWFWALDADDIGLGAQAAPPPALNEADKQARERVTEELSKLAELLPGLTTIREELYNRVELAASNVVVITTDYSMTADDRAKWQEWLEQNRVKVSRSVDPTDNNEITDTQSNANEISLSLPGGSLDSRTSIEIYELTGSDVTIPDTHRQVSSVYDFGPDGLTFNNPVILRINIAGFEGAWENLILAWYDAANGRWVPVPSVIDSANEEISGLVNHFTKFTVLAREKQPVSFADVGNGSYDWAQKEIQYLAFKEIVSDGGAGKFEPERPVTRGEFVAMLAKAMGIEAEAVPGDKPSFTDLQPENGDYDILQAAYAAGLVRGYDDGTLRADGQITREQIAALVTRALDLEPVATEPAFADADKVSGWATESVTAAAESGLLRGFPDGSFKPDMLTDRAQGAVLIYRILSLK